MLLNDANPELISAYIAVRDNVDLLINLLDQHMGLHSEEYYYGLRKQDASLLSPVEQAARLIYLNKTCYNGLYRVNRLGQFNVPYGRYKNPVLYDEEKIRAASQVLQGATLSSEDYSIFLDEHAKVGDFIYLDPPYMPVGQYSDFKRYTKEQFKIEEQKNLAELYTKLIQRGCYPILSNSYSARELYTEYEVLELKAARNINKDGNGRGQITEILVIPHRIL